MRGLPIRGLAEQLVLWGSSEGFCRTTQSTRFHKKTSVLGNCMRIFRKSDVSNRIQRRAACHALMGTIQSTPCRQCAYPNIGIFSNLRRHSFDQFQYLTNINTPTGSRMVLLRKRRCRPGSGWNWVWRILQQHEGIVSGGKVNRLIDGFCGERLPAIHLAHVDLSRCA